MQEVLAVVAVGTRQLVVNDLMVTAGGIEDVLQHNVVLLVLAIARGTCCLPKRRIHHSIGFTDHFAVEFGTGLELLVAVLDDRGDVLHLLVAEKAR